MSNGNISYSTPYILSSGNLSTTNRNNIEQDIVTVYTYNVGYYDDTKIKQRLSLLETEVSDIQSLDENFNYRLQQLENIDHSQFATKTEVQSLDNRVTTLETVPVGLTDSQINEIFEN